MAAPSLITVRPSAADIVRVRAQLSPAKARQALYQVVSRTGKWVRSRMEDRVVEDLNLVRKYAKRSLKLVLHRGDIPRAVITMSYEPLPLTAYNPKVSKRNGVSVVLSKSDGVENFKFAFRAKLKSGRVGIFERSRGKPSAMYRMAMDKKLGRMRRFKLGVTPRGISGALPVKQLMGPPAIDVWDGLEQLGELQADADAYMRKQFRSQLSRFFGRAA